MKTIFATVFILTSVGFSYGQDLTPSDFAAIKTNVREVRREISSLKSRLERLDSLLAKVNGPDYSFKSVPVAEQAVPVAAEPIVITTTSYPLGATYSSGPVYSQGSPCAGGNCPSPSQYQVRPTTRYFFRR